MKDLKDLLRINEGYTSDWGSKTFKNNIQKCIELYNALGYIAYYEGRNGSIREVYKWICEHVLNLDPKISQEAEELYEFNGDDWDNVLFDFGSYLNDKYDNETWDKMYDSMSEDAFDKKIAKEFKQWYLKEYNCTEEYFNCIWNKFKDDFRYYDFM